MCLNPNFEIVFYILIYLPFHLHVSLSIFHPFTHTFPFIFPSFFPPIILYHLTMSYHPLPVSSYIHLFIQSNSKSLPIHLCYMHLNLYLLIISHLRLYAFPIIYSLLPTGNIGSNKKIRIERHS